MDVVTICARCLGKGQIDTTCGDPQCGDSTWDHSCWNCRCASCGASGVKLELRVDPLPAAVMLLGRAHHVDLRVTLLHRVCPSCGFDFIGSDAIEMQDGVVVAFRNAIRELEARVIETAAGEVR